MQGHIYLCASYLGHPRAVLAGGCNVSLLGALQPFVQLALVGRFFRHGQNAWQLRAWGGFCLIGFAGGLGLVLRPQARESRCGLVDPPRCPWRRDWSACFAVTTTGTVGAKGGWPTTGFAPPRRAYKVFRRAIFAAPCSGGSLGTPRWDGAPILWGAPLAWGGLGAFRSGHDLASCG